MNGPKPRPPPTVVLATRIPKPLRDLIVRKAKRQGVTASALVAYALEAQFTGEVRR